MAHILEQETNQPLLEFATEKLFGPLGINHFAWQVDPEGAQWGGLGLQLRARDLAKFGQLYLNEGAWNGRQLIPRDWVLQSGRQQIETFGPNSGYSFQWWISRNQHTPIYYGQGFGGQALMLVPEKNLLVVALQAYLVSNEQHGKQWSDFVEKVFIPVFQAAR